MKLSSISIRNFRRLESVAIDIEDNDTIFVGPNNSGKTSATAIFRCFLGGWDFKIHDFSVDRMADFEKFVASGEPSDLPEISIDLWFSIDPRSIAFGRVFTLLPKLSDFTRVGLRLSYGIGDAKKLREQYLAAHPADSEGSRSRTLFQYLAVDDALKRNSVVRYASLEEEEVEVKEDGATPQIKVVATPLEPDEGKRVVKNLIKVEFVDAQRNINDDDSSRSNRLSAAFATYYQKNLEQLDALEEAHRVIDENNRSLTDHYEKQFKPLMTLIRKLGVPSVNDRQLRIISSLSPATALRGSTELLYVDPEKSHELPELYNGLGFKNLIYMAIQARHFHSQWLMTKENRPLCLLIFIEEPEVHVHAQVQQTFIENVWGVINDAAKAAEQPSLVPQLVVTTHSSHILDAVDFEKVRYFQRCHSISTTSSARIRSASKVRSLRTFRPEADVEDGLAVPPEDSLAFLKRYLRLTHCDLFFADAAILVEGAVEKLLMPSMIEESSPGLRAMYLTVLEVGGAYAHRFDGLLKFLDIPYLIITDLDSVSGTGHPTTCRADTADARTSNASLRRLCGKERIQDLVSLQPKEKIDASNNRYIAYEGDINVKENDGELLMRPRTLEEAIAYENFRSLRDGKISLGIAIPADLMDAYEAIYMKTKSDSFKKTDFAMSLLASGAKWVVPAYIAEGLRWLENRLSAREITDTPENDAPKEGPN